MDDFYKYIAFYFLFFFFTATTNSQVVGTKVFTVSEDGSSKILTLLKHSHGYLLVGTSNGIYRFNGNNFINYNYSNSVKNKAITAIAEDSSHTIWVGFQSGEIGLIKNGVVELLQAEEGYPKVPITCILMDTKGIIYFATAGEGIYYYQNKRFYNINKDDGLSDDYVYEIKHSGNNSIIAATDHGINFCSVNNGKKHISFYNGNRGIPDNIIRTITQISANSFLLGMQDKGIGLFNTMSNAFQPFSNIKEWIYGQVNSIIKTNNEVWVATESSGIIRTATQGSSPVTFSNDVSHNKVSRLLQDDEGNIWFSSNNQLVKTAGTQVQNIIPLTADLYAQVHTILADREGSVWINYNYGLKRFTQRNNSWQSKDHLLAGITEKTDITSLYQDKHGNIWIGTLGKGVIVLNPATGKTRTITEDSVLVNGSVLSINGRGDEIWISSLSGAIFCKLSDVNRDIYKPYTFQNFTDVSGIGSAYVYSIMPDSKNRVWFATDGKGVTVLEHGKFKNYSEKQGLKSNVIYNLCEDFDGNIWFSALNAGVYKFDGKTFTNFSKEQGLSDATITALSIDSKGNIIAVSKKGANIIDRKTNAISYIDHGITEWNDDPNCITKTTDGHVLFITSGGIISYYPSYTSLQPKIVLDNVQLFLNNINHLEQNEFSYDENNISFGFSGISLSHPDKVQYQYKLEGLSNQWIATKDIKINFPKLPAGSYTFKVRASLNSNFSNSSEASYRFVIHQPFWLRWWFIVLVLLVIASLLYILMKTREKRLKRWGKLEKERIQSQFETLKSQVNPHFLFNSFNTLISVIEENPDKAVEYVEHLSDLYRKIVTYRDKDLISLKEEMELIDDYFFIQQKRFGKNLTLNVDLSMQDLNDFLIAPLTLQLLAENAVKHNAISCETPLDIDVFIKNNSLVVSNNLNEKMTSEKGAGMGLQNIQNRYKLLNTEPIKIEKTSSSFAVYIPIIKASA